MILDHTYSGPAHPSDVWGSHKSTTEKITGSFRLIRFGRSGIGSKTYALVGNGEKPEKFWRIHHPHVKNLRREDPPDA